VSRESVCPTPNTSGSLISVSRLFAGSSFGVVRAPLLGLAFPEWRNLVQK
jgi:hypothetical protein